MSTAPPVKLADIRTEPEAVIRQARRRQHRRWLVVGSAIALALAGAAMVSG
jgi:hypothetical protein